MGSSVFCVSSFSQFCSLEIRAFNCRNFWFVTSISRLRSPRSVRIPRFSIAEAATPKWTVGIWSILSACWCLSSGSRSCSLLPPANLFALYAFPIYPLIYSFGRLSYDIPLHSVLSGKCCGFHVFLCHLFPNFKITLRLIAPDKDAHIL